MSVDFDVTVVGAGGAGLAAAHTAAQAGATVLVAESAAKAGGSTRLSDAILMAAGTSVQRRNGVQDSPDEMFRYYMTLNRWQLEAGLVRAFCDEGAAVVDWLIELGLKFGPVERSGNEHVPRGHPTIGLGEALVSTLETACRRRNVEFAFGNRVEELVLHEGRIVGVRARGELATSSSVVLAAGGFARNPAQIRRFLGGRLLAGDHPSTPAAAGCRGDALTMGERVGAALVGRDRAHWVPAPFTPAEAVLVTAEGRRFVDESVDHSIRTTVADYHGHTYFAVFDENIRRRGHRHPFVARTTAGFLFQDGDLNLGEPTVRDWITDGTLHYGESLPEVAARAELKPDSVVGAITHYNTLCAAGQDRDFEKDTSHLVPVRVPPFYVVRIAPASLVATFCGLRIDPNARVLDHAGRPILGLFAAGESAGGIVGEIYAGHGNSVTAALVFGRRAGATSAEWARRVSSA